MKKIVLLVLINLFFSNLLFFAQDKKAKFTVKNLKINTKFSEYGATYFGKNSIYYASNEQDAKSKKSKLNSFVEEYQAPNYEFLKGYSSDNGEIENPVRLSNETNKRFNQTNASFTPDMKYVYFTQNNIQNGKTVGDVQGIVNIKIYRAEIDNYGNWINPIPLPFNSDNYSCAHPSVSEDNRVLFFASDMKGSYGKSDIFWVAINADGTYGKPFNIGDHVNSTARENFPYVDENILYFASDREGSIGGLDIYMVFLDDPFSSPINLGEPINSNMDDFCFVIERENKIGYFSSNRKGGKGEDDIYYFIQNEKYKECKQLVKGVVVDATTMNPIEGTLVSVLSTGNKKLNTVTTDSEGNFSTDVECLNDYRIDSFNKEYSKNSQNVSLDPKNMEREILIFLEPKPQVDFTEKDEVNLKKMEVESYEEEVEYAKVVTKKGFDNEILDLPNINFDLDQSYLTKDAKRILDEAYYILKDNPSLYVEFAAYTDCRASDSYNLLLSSIRTKNAVDYIVSKGISPQRIYGRGYGESKPVNHCVDDVKCTESEHLQNRRAEFIIIKK